MMNKNMQSMKNNEEISLNFLSSGGNLSVRIVDHAPVQLKHNCVSHHAKLLSSSC